MMNEVEMAVYDLMKRVIKIEKELGMEHVTHIPPMYADGSIPDRKTAKSKKQG